MPHEIGKAFLHECQHTSFGPEIWEFCRPQGTFQASLGYLWPSPSIANNIVALKNPKVQQFSLGILKKTDNVRKHLVTDHGKKRKLYQVFCIKKAKFLFWIHNTLEDDL